MARILIVEDNKNLGLMEAVALKHEGFVVDFAEDGNAAGKLILKNDYDVLVLDILLPGLTGFELAEIAKTRKGHVPKVILLSGITQGTNCDAGQIASTAHADAFLAKPLSLKALVDTVRSLLPRA
jgi:DNA-binding response OmpR family regulator